MTTIYFLKTKREYEVITISNAVYTICGKLYNVAPPILFSLRKFEENSWNLMQFRHFFLNSKTLFINLSLDDVTDHNISTV